MPLRELIPCENKKRKLKAKKVKKAAKPKPAIVLPQGYLADFLQLDKESFKEYINRLKTVTGCDTASCLAKALHHDRRCFLMDKGQRFTIPPALLIKAMLVWEANPLWLLGKSKKPYVVEASEELLSEEIAVLRDRFRDFINSPKYVALAQQFSESAWGNDRELFYQTFLLSGDYWEGFLSKREQNALLTMDTDTLESIFKV